jgi:hypothetical protein
MMQGVTWWTTDEYDSFRAEILGDFEDDGLGVYEVWWTANSRYPTRPVSDRLRLAEAIVSELLASGTARLYRGEWIGPTQPHQAVPADQVDAVLCDWATWVPQEGATVWMDSKL